MPTFLGSRRKEEGFRMEGKAGTKVALTRGSFLVGRGFLREIIDGESLNMAKIFLNHVSVELDLKFKFSLTL